MDKIIKPLLVGQIILAYCIIVFLYFEWSYLSFLYGDSAAVDVLAEDKASFNDFLEWAREKEIDLIRFDEEQDGTATVYMTDQCMVKKTSIIRGNYPKIGEFLSDKYTCEKNQSGTIKAISPFHQIKIYSLAEAEHLGFSSRYYISINTESKVNSMEKELNNKGIRVEFVSFVNAYNMLLSVPWIGREVIFLFGMVSISFAIATILFLAVFIRKNGVGSQLVSTWENAFAILKNHLICKMSFRLLFLTYLCSIFYIFMIKRQIYLWIIVTWLFFAVFIFYALAFYLIILLLVKINRIPSYVGKKRKLSLSGMIIHITLIVALIFSVSFFCTSMEKTIAECNKIYKCRNMDNIYRIVMNYMGQDCSLEKEVEIQNLANKAYIELTKQNYGFLMDADSIHMCDVLGCDSELNGLYSENGQETHITITPNYLRFNPIMTLNGESVEKMIDYDENVLNILVPEKYMSKENELIKQFLDYLSFNRFQIYERVYKNSSNNIWNPKEEQSLVNIIPIKNGQAFYTFTDIIRNEENNSIVDPVSVVYTNNFHPSYILGEASRVLYFQYDDNVKENIDSYLSKIVGVKGFIKAESIYKEKLLNLRRFVIDSMLSFLWLVLIILSYIEVGILSHKDKIQWINAIDALTIFIAMVICILASQVNIIFVGHIDIVKGIVLLVGIGMMLVLRNYNVECVSEGRSNEI